MWMMKKMTNTIKKITQKAAYKGSILDINGIQLNCGRRIKTVVTKD
jgi:hypothetical protein